MYILGSIGQGEKSIRANRDRGGYLWRERGRRGKYEVEEEEEEEEEEEKGPGGKGLKLPRKKWISYGFGSLGVRQFGAPLKSACQNPPSARRRPLLDVHSNTRLQLQYLQLPAWKYVGDLWLNRHYSYCLSYRSINPSHSSTFSPCSLA